MWVSITNGWPSPEIVSFILPITLLPLLLLLGLECKAGLSLHLHHCCNHCEKFIFENDLTTYKSFCIYYLI